MYCHQTSVFFILIATIGNAIGHFASPCVTLCCSGQGTNPLVQIPFLNCRLVISNSFFLLLKSLFCWPDTVKSTSLCVCRIPLKLTDIGHKSVKRSFSLARIPVLFVFHASNLRFLVHPRHPHGFALAPKAVAVGRDLRSAIGGPGGGVRHAAGDHLERWLGAWISCHLSSTYWSWRNF